MDTVRAKPDTATPAAVPQAREAAPAALPWRLWVRSGEARRDGELCALFAAEGLRVVPGEHPCPAGPVLVLDADDARRPATRWRLYWTASEGTRQGAARVIGSERGDWQLVVAVFRELALRRAEPGAAADREAEVARLREALEESDRRLVDFTSAAADWYWETDAGLHTTAIVGRMEEVLGVVPAEVIGNGYAKVVRERLRPRGDWSAHLRELEAHRPFDDFEFEFEGPGGAPKTVRVSGRPVFDAAGAFRGYRGAALDVTAQRLAERALAASERQLRAIFEHAGVGMMLLGASGEILRCNLALCRLLDYMPETLRAWHVLALMHPEDIPVETRRREACALLSVDAPPVERRLLRRDGTAVWARITATSAQGAGAGRGAVIALVEDVSARHSMHEALRRSEQRLRLITDNSPAAIYLKDLEGRYQLVNRRLCDWYAATPADVLGERVDRFCPRPLVERLREHDRKVLQSRVPVAREYEWCLPDGSARVREDLKFPIESESGELIGIGGIISDITERCLAEAALRASEELFRQLVENLDEGVLIWDASARRAVYFNPVCAQLLGFSPEESEVDATRLRRRVHPDDLHLLGDARRRAASGEATEFEYRVVRADGVVRWLWERGIALRSEHGMPQRRLCIIKEITDRKLGEERRLEHARQQREALLRELHHRIKNALQGVTGLLRQHGEREPALAPAIGEAVRQLDAMTVVHGMQSGRAGRRVRVEAIVKAIIADTPAEFSWRLGSDAKSDEARAWAIDEDEAVPVALALSELMINAVKHSVRRAGRAQARVRISRKPEWLSIVLSNPCRGLPEGFDFATQTGCGTGLQLVAALLPPAGARLSFVHRARTLRVELELTPPVLRPVAPCARAAEEGPG